MISLKQDTIFQGRKQHEIKHIKYSFNTKLPKMIHLIHNYQVSKGRVTHHNFIQGGKL